MIKKRTVLSFVVICVSLLVGIVGCKINEKVASNPTGVLVQYQGCKQISAVNTGYGAGISGNETCLEYNFDGSTLSIKHINAAFNCCPGDIAADIAIRENVIFIGEKEMQPGCFCLCLYDLDFELIDLQPGIYTVIIHEPYLPEKDQPLEYTINLEAGDSGIFCLPRNHYPWVD